MAAGSLIGIISGAAGASFIAPLQRLANRKLNRHLPYDLLSTNNYIEAFRAGFISPLHLKRYMAELGLDETQTDILTAVTQSYLSPEQIVLKRYADSIVKVMTWHEENRPPGEDPEIGIFPPSELDEIKNKYYQEMTRNGYRIKEAERLFEAQRPIPSPSDLKEFLSKEGFEPEAIARFGLMSDYPPIWRDLMRSLSVPDIEAEKIWTTHWIHPSRGELIRMYFLLNDERTDRSEELAAELGETYANIGLSVKDLEEAFKLLEITPFWWARLRALSFASLNITTLQQLYAYGEKNNDWFIGKIRDIGYTLEDAKLVLSMWGKRAPYSAKNPLASNIILKYERGSITREAAVAAFQVNLIPMETINFNLGIVENKKFFEIEKNLIKGWKLKYKRDNLSTQELSDIIALDIDDAPRINRIVDIIESTVPVNYFRIRSRVIRRAWEDGQITDDEMRAKLQEIRFSDKDIDWIIDKLSPVLPQEETEEDEDEDMEDPE